MTDQYQLVLLKPDGFDFVESFREVMESLQEGFKEIGLDVPIHVNFIDPTRVPILFGAHHLTPAAIEGLPRETIIYNLEQLLPGYPWFSEAYLGLLAKFQVWDFSERNIRFLSQNQICTDARLVPIGYSPGLTRIPPGREDVDVLFFGIQTPRRIAILNALGDAGLKVVALRNVWGAERDRWISRAKVVLNIHGQQDGVFEIVRVLYLLANRKVVVCEIDDPHEIPEDLRQAVISTRIDDVVAACLAAVRHEGLRRLIGSAGFHAVTRPKRRIADILRHVLDDADDERASSSQLPAPKSIAIGTVGMLGDIVAAEPALRYLRWCFPKAVITLIARREHAILFVGHPALNHIHHIDRASEFFELARSGRFDRFFDLNLDGWGCTVSGETWRKPSEWLPLNADNYYFFGPLLPVLSLAAGLPPLLEAPGIPPNSDAGLSVDRMGLPDRFIVFHCRSTEIGRDWDNAKWGELADELTNRYRIPILEIGTVAATTSQRINNSLCGQISLPECAEVIRRAVCLIGIDSGPAHIAVAVQTPAVVIAGQFRRFTSYFPYTGRFAHSPRLRFVFNTDGPAAAITVARIIAAIEAVFSPSAEEALEKCERGTNSPPLLPS